MEEIKKLTLQPQWNYNPYVGSGDKAVVLRKGVDSKVISRNTDNVNFYKDVHGMARIREVDNDRFVKIYTANLSLWFELSIPAQRVLQYILTILPRNSDMIMLSYEQVKAYTEYKSFTSVYDAINELINKKIIARSKVKEMFYINPSFIFNGDRIIFSEAIMRTSQAMHERYKKLEDMATEQHVNPDVLAVAEDSPGTESNFLSRAKTLY